MSQKNRLFNMLMSGDYSEAEWDSMMQDARLSAEIFAIAADDRLVKLLSRAQVALSTILRVPKMLNAFHFWLKRQIENAGTDIIYTLRNTKNFDLLFSGNINSKNIS